MEVPIIKITEGAGAAKIAFSRLSAWVCGVNMKGWKTPSQIKTKNLLSSAVATRLSNTNSTECRATQDNLALGWGPVVPIRPPDTVSKKSSKGFPRLPGLRALVFRFCSLVDMPYLLCEVSALLLLAI
jgi:hypothetical protein